jgi:hypothetical protein
MKITKTYDNFPAWIVALSNLAAVAIYVSGLIIIQRTGWIPAFLFLAFILALEYRLLSTHCVNCFYWGKVCGFGKGKLSSKLFSRGDTSKFCAKEMSWKELIPDLLISLVPLTVGIVLMIIKFDIIIFIAVLLLLALTTLGNNFIRGDLTCKYCRQRELGCPAERMFSKK